MEPVATAVELQPLPLLVPKVLQRLLLLSMAFSLMENR